MVLVDNAKIIDPCVPINMIASWLNDWTILQKKHGNQRKMKWVVRMLEETTNEVWCAPVE